MDKFFSKLGGAAMATLIAVLSGLGVGSGGLLVGWLTVFEGIDAETARGLNLLFFVFSASAAFAVHLKKGRVKLRLVLFLAACACIGTFLGTYIGTRIDPLMLKKVFGVMLIISGIYTLSGNVSSKFKKRKSKKISANR